MVLLKMVALLLACLLHIICHLPSPRRPSIRRLHFHTLLSISAPYILPTLPSLFKGPYVYNVSIWHMIKLTPFNGSKLFLFCNPIVCLSVLTESKSTLCPAKMFDINVAEVIKLLVSLSALFNVLPGHCFCRDATSHSMSMCLVLCTLLSVFKPHSIWLFRLLPFSVMRSLVSLNHMYNLYSGLLLQYQLDRFVHVLVLSCTAHSSSSARSLKTYFC